MEVQTWKSSRKQMRDFNSQIKYTMGYMQNSKANKKNGNDLSRVHVRDSEIRIDLFLKKQSKGHQIAYIDYSSWGI